MGFDHHCPHCKSRVGEGEDCPCRDNDEVFTGESACSICDDILYTGDLIRCPECFDMVCKDCMSGTICKACDHAKKLKENRQRALLNTIKTAEKLEQDNGNPNPQATRRALPDWKNWPQSQAARAFVPNASFSHGARATGAE